MKRLCFQVATRLGRFTGDNQYVIDAGRIWNWTVSVSLQRPRWCVTLLQGCSVPNPDLWSYNAGVLFYDAAITLHVTGDESTPQPRRSDLISADANPFADGIVLQESIYKPGGTAILANSPPR